ncbi:MAG: hypothetical protein A2150_07430 [Candidatus Muproteobacteria bacterium RBG_16_64_11]|uniref:Cobalamin ABC transporter n=1 Tax=Candidatus Muproteobacteria bacterium RBG_16_64_11 TaxID=1817758 RepID=A0A1F6TAF1_9PROT|nr:MAG: hypothetical protein A2150_07430 [Candidatus Muproteobacteria bacterium RBG_16_64_11]
MLTLSTRHQAAIGLGLAALLIVTRGQHFASLHSLPGASWAVFFLAGIYLRPLWALPALLGLAWLLDFAAFTWGGASGFCLTPAYVFLLPAYSALWFAGRWYARRHCFTWRTLLPLGAAMLAGAAVCELFSSGGFYFFSGRFAEPNLAEFGVRLVKYFPSYLQSVGFYVGIAAVIHALFGLAHGATRARNATST